MSHSYQSQLGDYACALCTVHLLKVTHLEESVKKTVLILGEQII